MTTTVQYVDCPTTGTHDTTIGDGWDTLPTTDVLAATGWTERQLADPYSQKLRDIWLISRCPGCHALIRVQVNGRWVRVPGDQHERRRIDIVTGPRARQGKCGGHCLNGKRSCDCQCRGRCHGRGSCQCRAA